jgi:hypothetical protein
LSATWEVDEKKHTSSEVCLCGQGTIDHYDVELSHTKVLRTKTDTISEVHCKNPECPSKKKLY